MKQNIKLKKSFLIILIISLSISALIGIIIFLFGTFSETETKLILTTLTMAGYSLTGLCGSALREKKRYAFLSLAGIIISIIGFLITVSAIWEIMNYEDVWKAAAISVVLAASIAHISLLLLLIKCNVTSIKVSLLLTVSFTLILAVMLIVLILGEIENEFCLRIIGAVAILDVLGTIVTPILRKITTIKENSPRL